MKFLAVWVLVLFPKHTLPFARGEIDLLSNEGVSTFAYSINMWTSCLVFNLLNSYLLVVQNPEETSTLITVLSPEQKGQGYQVKTQSCCKISSSTSLLASLLQVGEGDGSLLLNNLIWTESHTEPLVGEEWEMICFLVCLNLGLLDGVKRMQM